MAQKESATKEFYVRGGLYRDDSFTECIKEDAPIGPFATWEEAYASWEAISFHHLDDALRRYQIVDTQTKT